MKRNTGSLNVGRHNSALLPRRGAEPGMRRADAGGQTRRPVHGYTLVELLVAVGICGILAAVAYPSFQEHVVRTRRTEAQAALQRLMQQQERYFTLHNRYLAFGADAAAGEPVFRWWSGTSPSRSAYEIAAMACADQPIEQCVQLVATPGTERVDTTFRDAQCERLILTSTGERRATGAGQRCWR